MNLNLSKMVTNHYDIPFYWNVKFETPVLNWENVGEQVFCAESVSETFGSLNYESVNFGPIELKLPKSFNINAELNISFSDSDKQAVLKFITDTWLQGSTKLLKNIFNMSKFKRTVTIQKYSFYDNKLIQTSVYTVYPPSGDLTKTLSRNVALSPVSLNFPIIAVTHTFV